MQDYCNTDITIKDLCKKHKVSDRIIYDAIKNGEIQKRVKKEKYEENLANDNELKYYLLGLIGSDGCLHKNNRTIEISLHRRDKDILQKISLSLFKEDRVIVDGKRNRARLIISNKRIAKFYQDFGITPRKSATLKIRFEKIPKEYFHHFLRGYIDGDGCYNVKNINNIGIYVCGNEFMMNNLCEYVEKHYSIKGNVYHLNENISFPFFRWVIQKTVNAKQLIHIIYSDANYYIERKYNIIKSVLCAV